MNTKEFTNKLIESITFTIEAHTISSNDEKGAVRYWDRTTPYAIHPIWCAMTILTETTLHEEIRKNGCFALLWHDILEDTRCLLPEDADPKVRALVNELTFESFQDEIQGIWDRSDEAKLLKLYDKTSNLLDGTWMNETKWNQYTEYTSKLINFVVTKYGELNIVRISRGICTQR